MHCIIYKTSSLRGGKATFPLGFEKIFQTALKEGKATFPLDIDTNLNLSLRGGNEVSDVAISSYLMGLLRNQRLLVMTKY